jgi:uncharacterized small protein (DUF1192 family)
MADEKQKFPPVAKEAAALKAGVPSRFQVSIESFSEDGAYCHVALCTGTRLPVHQSVLKDIRLLGVSKSGGRTLTLAEIEVDASTEAGRLICLLAAEIERLTGERQNCQASPDGCTNVQKEFKEPPILFLDPSFKDRNTITVTCSGYACAYQAGRPNYAYYNAPQNISAFYFNHADNCQCLQIVKLGARQLRVMHESLPGVICGTSYTGKVYIDVAFG